MITVTASSLADQSRQLLAQLTQLDTLSTLTINVNGAEVDLSQLDQPALMASIFSSADIIYTKWDLVRYYILVAPVMIPQLVNRPLISWTQLLSQIQELPAKSPETIPPFVSTVDMYSEICGDNEPFILGQSLASVLWLVEQGITSFFPWHSQIETGQTGLPAIFINSVGTLNMSVANYPDILAFNLHFPSDNLSVSETSLARVRLTEAARLFHDYAHQLGLLSYIKTSGRGGFHIYIPIKRQYTYAEAQDASQIMCQHLITAYPEVFRKGWKIDGQTSGAIIESATNRRQPTLSAYSIHVPSGQVSVPFNWEDLGRVKRGFTLYDFIESSDHDAGSIDDSIALFTKQGAVKRQWQHLASNPQALPDALIT